VEGPFRIIELGDMAPEIPAVQSVRNQNRLSSMDDLEILSSFPRKEMNTKVDDNFAAHNTPNLHYLESGRGRYGTSKEGMRIRKIWARPILWKPSLLLSQGGSRARQGGARLKAPQGHNYNPLGAPRWLPIDIHSSESLHKMRDEIC
jgi:hypothetical protein